MAVSNGLRQLRLLLEERLNDGELRALCFDLEVPYENLSGDNKATKLLALISHLNNRSRLDDLLHLLQQDRPDLRERLLDIVEPSPSGPAEEAGNKRPFDNDDSEYGRSLQRFSQSIKRGRLLLFLGADLPSTITGLPGRQALADALARLEDLEPGKPLATVAQQVMQSGNRFIFTQFLRDQLDSTDLSPQPYHRLIAGLVQEHQLDMVVTTAYDGLLEQAFRQAGQPLNVVVSDTDLQFAVSGQATLLKLYGDWQQPTSLVVAEQDQSALLNGRHQQKLAMLDTVRLAFRMQAVLFVGVDLGDTAVTVLFDGVTGGQFQQPAYALCSGMNKREAQAWQSNRNLTIIDADPTAFLQALLEN